MPPLMPPPAGPTPPMAPGAAAPAGGTGPASAVGAMAGARHKGLASLKLAVEAMQRALPDLEMGSELQGATIKALADLTKHLGKEAGGGQNPMELMQQLTQLARTAQAQPQQNALLAKLGGGGGTAPPAAAA